MVSRLRVLAGLPVLALFLFAPLQAQQRMTSPHGDLKLACATCHIATGWTPVRVSRTFDHAKFGFALTGAHGTTTCRACHQALDFKGIEANCVSCHEDRHRGELGANCARCHTTRSFLDREVMVNAHRLTRFPLQGGHVSLDCSSCHKPGAQGSMQFVGTQTECVSCHRADFNSAPNHVASNFPTGCTQCHNQVAWGRVAGLAASNHPTSPIALTGVHANRLCADCHLAGQPYAAVRQTCDACHHTDYVGAKDPDHAGAGFSINCTDCHGLVAGWAGARFASHPTTPINPSQGAHGAVTCTQCHTTTPYSTVARTCDGCHHTDYVGAKDPDHAGAGFSINCTDCHAIVAGWAGANFASHPTTPINPSQGAHGAVTCTQCHTTTPYSTVARTCDGCHHQDYVATTNPNHTGAGYSTDCASCHQVLAGWAGANANHPTTPLALTGSHAVPPRGCADCHTTSSYSSVPQTCDGCHHPTYIGVADPNHTAVGMTAFAAANCSNCHSPTKSSWTGPTWTHMTIVNPQRVRLPHEGASCADCHQTSSNYTIKSCAKSGCHRNATGP
jgi:predicted CXXCH cytochrome family protein